MMIMLTMVRALRVMIPFGIVGIQEAFGVIHTEMMFYAHPTYSSKFCLPFWQYYSSSECLSCCQFSFFPIWRILYTVMSAIFSKTPSLSQYPTTSSKDRSNQNFSLVVSPAQILFLPLIRYTSIGPRLQRGICLFLKCSCYRNACPFFLPYFHLKILFK